MKDSFEKPSQQEVDPDREPYPEIEELKDPLENIFNQLAEGIENGEWYDLIVGDDASGRIPTLIVAGVLKEIAEARGLEKPDMLFFAGVKDVALKKKRKREIVEVLKQHEKWSGTAHKRALLVTDTIASGETIRDITDALKEQDIFFKIITIGTTFGVPKTEEQVKESREYILGGKIISGMRGTPKIYQMHTYGGVQKEDKASIHALPIRTALSQTGSDYPPNSFQKNINEARADSKEIAHEIAEKYLAEHPQKATGRKAA
ncbi:MAG: hypothetical protein HY457_02665 [Parcubacteria group bacterium]|nr:hypothetical protein [Parcubacteria group bacterium]